MIEVDFSFALLHSVIRAYNGESLISYITRSWEACFGKEEFDGTCIHICNAHLSHAVSTHLNRKKVQKRVRYLLIDVVRKLQESTTLKQCTDIFEDCVTVLYSAHKTKLYQEALNRLACDISIKQDVTHALQTNEISKAKLLREKSPFYQHFVVVARNVKQKLQHTEEETEENKFHSNTAAEILLQYFMAYIPYGVH